MNDLSLSREIGKGFAFISVWLKLTQLSGPAARMRYGYMARMPFCPPINSIRFKSLQLGDVEAVEALSF